ncbi:M50 family metallopeptidase [Radiobacillus deserti]|uniref:M50 family metallopeptidase n=1 Tax=Radiobacillus deserti TaxID=2594883 RepID=A0A516KIZ2_9BACI|nr:M50 family metallopeptidase [Radiobacillus deserti]QDP41363.1 M50 family metallopeptidase [Radiobacillus deserti]
MEFIFYILLAYVFMKVPVVGPNLRLLNTLIHECSHVLVAKMTGGRGHSIKLHPDTSGTALVQSSTRFSGILSTYAGYTGPSLTAFALFYLLKQGNYQLVMLFFLTLVVGTTILWIRNVFGLLWSISFAGLLYVLFYYELDEALLHGSIILCSIVLLESITSAAFIFFKSMTSPREAGDATILQRVTWIPAVIWGMLFFVQSVFVGVKIFLQYVGV